MIKLILFLLCVKLGHSYPEGAPKSVCTSMTPNHYVKPQQCQSNYIIQSDKIQYNTNEIIRIIVRGATNNDNFKGILLTAKNQNNQQIIGTWSVTNPSIKTIACNDVANTAITHSSSGDKSQIEALWHTPSILSSENTIIRATIVKSYKKIYVDCFNITLTPNQNKSSRDELVSTNTERNSFTKTNTNLVINYENDAVSVTMTTTDVKLGEWRAIGFSLDQQMGDEYIFVCQVSSTGEASLRRMHTKLGKRPPSVSNEDVTVHNAAYENGQLTCQFSFETNSEQADGEPAPIVIDKNYYIIFAAGILRTPEQVAKHNFTYVTSKTYQLQNPETLHLDELDPTTTTSTNPTGSSSATTSAAETSHVGVNINWTYAAGVTTIKMIINNLKISQWTAIGFSMDEYMGQDHVFICRHLSNNTIVLQRFINPGGHRRPVLVDPTTKPGGVLNVIREKFENGITYCDFTLSNFGEIKRFRRQDSIPPLSQTSNYYPLIAIGNLDSSDTLRKHSSYKVVSRQVSLDRSETIVYNIQSTDLDTSSLMKAHGIIMVFTWIVLVSTGILVARYFKRSWSERKICGKAIWFAIHRTIMTTVAILTLVAFILILVYKKGQWVSRTNERGFAHSIIGIIVISFAIIQPFIALFRCHPEDRYRFIFNYVHAFIGFSAFILSIAAIFLAMFLSDFNFELNKEWAILVAWSCWLPIIFIIFEIIEIYYRKQSSTNEKSIEFDVNDHHGNGNIKIKSGQSIETAYKDRIKALFLVFHIMIAFGLALALVILIGQSKLN